MPVVSQHKPRFHLRTILVIVNLFVLIVPLGSIYFFRLYENELVRQTESELIAQGAYISALYKQTIHPLIINNATYGNPTTAKPENMDKKYNLIAPILDLTSATIYPPRPQAEQGLPADETALKVGKIIFPAIEEATATTLAGVRIVDYQGVVVAGREETELSLAHIDEIIPALKGNYTALLRERISDQPRPPLASLSRGTDIRVFIAMPIIHGERVVGAVLLSRSPRNILKGLYDDWQSLAIASGIIVGITVLLTLLTSYAISRPIYALIEQAKRVAGGEKDIKPINEPVTQELALLSYNISSMANIISERSDYIRNFAMHVSHEFKTPLTAIQGAVELIEEHGASMPPEQFRKFLGNITKDIDRLKILVSRLLELARADVMQPVRENCDLTELLASLQSDYRDSGIKVQASNCLGIKLPMPFDIARVVFSNFIENSNSHGASQVEISVTSDQPNLIISIHDNGSGISEANMEKLFTPFFTTKREQGGTGLGLVIIRSLLNAYNAEIRCEPSEIGANFIISFSYNKLLQNKLF